MKSACFIIFIIFLFSSPAIINGQSFRNILVDSSDNGKVFSEFLHELERTYKIDFICDERK